MKKNILLVGGFIEIIELCEENDINIIGIIDSNQNQDSHTIPLIGKEDNINDWGKQYQEHEIIISPDLPQIRKSLALFYSRHGFNFARIESKHARISKSAIIDMGTVVQAGVNISSRSVIGSFVKINNNVNIMHDVTIGNYTTVAPNAVLLGHVSVGDSCYIGANATLLPHIKICDNVTIGAGAVVTKSIVEPNSVYIGVPAKKLLK